MEVGVVIDPFLIFLGNEDYISLMEGLESSVIFNDGYDNYYIKDFVKKEAEKRPLSMFIDLKLKSIALITLEKGKVSAKMFLQNSVLKMMGYPNEEKLISFSIDDIKGYYLIEKNNRYYEKGFITEV